MTYMKRTIYPTSDLLKLKNKEIEKRDSKMTEWSFMTLARKKTTFLKFRAYVCTWNTST